MRAGTGSEAGVLKNSSGRITPEDQQIVNLYLANNAAVIGQVGNWVERVVGWRFWVLRDEREDICQEVHKRLTMNLQAGRLKGSLKAYVEKIAYYYCVDMTRRYYPVKSIDDPDGPVDPPDPRQDPSREVEQREVREILENVYDKMPRTCLEILTLRFFDDLQYEQISEAIGIPLGTVKSRISRCCAKAYAIYRKWKRRNSRRRISTTLLGGAAEGGDLH
jgi:RNA polymerase sigma-70 factor (ECF subfamily)